MLTRSRAFYSGHRYKHDATTAIPCDREDDRLLLSIRSSREAYKYITVVVDLRTGHATCPEHPHGCQVTRRGPELAHRYRDWRPAEWWQTH